MSKKTMLLALSVVSAILFALPAVASATPAHIDKADTFTASGSTLTVLEDANGREIKCHEGVSGSGSFESTTTGTLTLEFNNCTTSTIFGNVSCTTHESEGGTGISKQIRTTKLPFHLITLAEHSPGVLITPNATTGYFAHFTCAGVDKTVGGNGVIGTITSPTCGSETASSTATLKFEQGATTGSQKHTEYTDVKYNLESPTGTNAAQIGEGQIHFAGERTITCT